jgi:hypothetical protein
MVARTRGVVIVSLSTIWRLLWQAFRPGTHTLVPRTRRTDGIESKSIRNGDMGNRIGIVGRSSSSPCSWRSSRQLLARPRLARLAGHRGGTNRQLRAQRRSVPRAHRRRIRVGIRMRRTPG